MEPDLILTKEEDLKEVAHTQLVSTEPDLLVAELDAPEGVTHVQMVNAEPDWKWRGKPDTLEVAHTQMVDTEPDWISRGEPDTPNTNAPVHLAGTEHEVLMGMEEDEPDDWLLQEMEEEEAAGKTTSIKGDKDPCVELQESRVSRLAMLKEKELLTFTLSPSHTIPEAAWTQCSLVVNIGMLAIPETEGSMDIQCWTFKYDKLGSA